MGYAIGVIAGLLMLLLLTLTVALLKLLSAAISAIFQALVAFITLPFRGVIGAISFGSILTMVIAGGFYAVDVLNSNARREEAIKRVSANFRHREKVGPKRLGEVSPRLRSIAAAACVEALWKAKISTGKDHCEHDSVLIVGKDAEAAAVHDRDAISEHPQWVRLTYRDAKLSNAKPSRTCRDRKMRFDPQFGHSKDGKIECDEYPFRATKESGDETRFRFIRQDHNRVEGSVFLGLLQRCGHIAAYAENSESENQFLVIPAPNTVPVSFYLCGE